MTTPLTDFQALAYAQAAGFSGNSLVTVVAIAHAESSLVSNARLTNTDTFQSVDRGVLQINNHWHPEVSDACADSPACAFKQGYRISNSGSDFTPWATYNAGAHRQYLPQVQAALAQLPDLMRLDHPFALPAGMTDYQATVTQSFGPNSDPASLEPPAFVYPDSSVDYWEPGAGATRYLHVHGGVDYNNGAVPYGTPIAAPANGTVTHAGRDDLGTNGADSGFGLSVRINHGPVETLYGHLSATGVTVGQKIAASQLIAHSGGVAQYPGDWRAGLSTGPHLHWGIRRVRDGHWVDPWNYVTFPELAPKPAPTPTPTDGDPITWVSFTVTTMNDHEPVRAFDGPSIRCNPLADIPGATAITCDGWMLGQGRPDTTRGNAIDHRWYHCSFGLVSSSRVLGNAPGSKP